LGGPLVGGNFSCNGGVPPARPGRLPSYGATVRGGMGGNYEGYTKREVEQAIEARKAQAMLGNPSEKDYRGMVSNRLVTNCPVNNTDITNTFKSSAGT
jgi:hypothetical protein